MAKKRGKAKTPAKAPSSKVPSSNVLRFPLLKLPPPKLEGATALFQCGLVNGLTISTMVAAAEMDRLWAKVQEPDDFHIFIVFDSLRRRSALNIRHVQWSTFNGAPIKPALYLDGAGGTVDVLFGGQSKIWQFDVDPDECRLEEIDETDDGDEESAQMANLFYYLDSAHPQADYSQPLVNAARTTTWLRLNEISFLSAPIGLLRPSEE